MSQIAKHGVGLASARLAVHEDGAVDAVEGAHHDLRAGLLVDARVTLVAVKAAI